MTSRLFKERYTDRRSLGYAQIKSLYIHQKLIFFVFAGLLSLAANKPTEEVISEKRIGVAMRMIGHEVLMCLGDSESRVMPIEKVEERYKFDSFRISFEVELEVEPDDIASIIDRVMKETGMASNYFVEVEQCETKEVMHSFEVGNALNHYLIPCEGRRLPEDCYSLVITILDDAASDEHLSATTSDRSSIDNNPPLTSSKAKEANLLESALFIIPLLILIGFTGYFIRKKDTADKDPNLILIGTFQFDKRTMVLSYKNKSVQLSNKEAALLSLLHTSANAPLEREVILQKVWGDEGDYVGRTLDVFISKLRKKLEADASVKIVNLRGVGYKLVTKVPK